MATTSKTIQSFPMVYSKFLKSNNLETTSWTTNLWAKILTWKILLRKQIFILSLMMVGSISGKLPTTKDMEKASLSPRNKYTKANTIEMWKFKDAKKTETGFTKVNFLMEKGTGKVSSLGTMASSSKENGKTAKKNGFGIWKSLKGDYY